MSPLPRLAFIGVGNMGNPMAANLLRAGYALTVFDTVPAKTDNLVALGAQQAHSVAQAVALAKIDVETFGPAQPAITPWLSTKALILIAYFTSEAGASQQLRYEIVPGRFDPDLPLDKDWKPLSNDWAANAIKKGIA